MSRWLIGDDRHLLDRAAVYGHYEAVTQAVDAAIIGFVGGLQTSADIRSVCDETVLDPLFATVSRPFRTVFRGLGAGFWNLGGQTEKMAKKREKTGKKWARNGLKKVGPMTD